MAARRRTTILPAMTLAEAVETTRIHSVAGLTGDRTALVTTRPFRAPHYTVSDAGLIGGGHVPRPGEGALAYYRIRMRRTGTRLHSDSGLHLHLIQNRSRVEHHQASSEADL
jgi:hypothetical protein